MDFTHIGIVIIGRNEGERLNACFASMSSIPCSKIYVDSGSTDNSLSVAESHHIITHSLDPDRPFSAARARNEGFALLLQQNPQLKYVQFIDGDCTLIPGWLDKAAAFMDGQDKVAAVCGRLLEQYPERSIYNRLCDIEWDTPVGEAKASGGIVMMRVTAFKDASGFRTDLIAGEEPELCVRLRANGWLIWRLDENMAWHDAAILHFKQWWQRTRRTGYAFAEGAFLHGSSPEQHWVKEARSPWFWAGLLPVSAVLAGFADVRITILLLMLYPVQIIRLALKGKHSLNINLQRSAFLVLGKFPELMGQLQFLRNRLLKHQGRLIEYK